MSFEKKRRKDLWIQIKSQWMFVQITSSKPWNFCYQTWYGDDHRVPESYAKRLVCYLQGHGHSKGSCNQIMTVSTILSELLILLLPNLVWWYIISQSVLWRNWIAVFKVKVTAKLENVNEYLSIQYLLNCWTSYHQTWYGDASSWARISQKYWFAVWKVKVTVKDHVIKIWLFAIWL